MRHQALLTLLAVLPLSAPNAHAEGFEAACEQLQRDGPRVSVTPEPVQVDPQVRQVPLRALNQEASGAVTHRQGGVVLGTTQAIWHMEYVVHMVRVTHQRTGEVCYAPQLEMSLGYEPLRISVGEEVAADACTQAHVLAHEHGHVTIFEAQLPDVAARLEAALGPWFKAGRTHDVTAVATRMTAAFSVALPDLVHTAATAQQAAHDAFDAFDATRFNIQACAGGVRRVIQAAHLPG